MNPRKSVSRRHFTEAARAAAIEARRRKREEAVPREAPEVYVIRLPDTHLQFGWGIRRAPVEVAPASPRDRSRPLTLSQTSVLIRRLCLQVLRDTARRSMH